MRRGRPAGTPLGRALDIPAGIVYDELREAVAAIERVHGDGDLLPIPMRLVTGIDDLGRFRYDEVTGEPISISIRSPQEHPQLTVVHEVGHLLDWTILGHDLSFGSTINPRMLAWLDAVSASRAYGDLTRLERRGAAPMIDGRGLTVMMPLTERERQVVRICLQPDESWARSYAQWVAARANYRPFTRGIEAFRSRVPGRVYYPLHWDDDDFTWIDAAIERLFRERGWRR